MGVSRDDENKFVNRWPLFHGSDWGCWSSWKVLLAAMEFRPFRTLRLGQLRAAVPRQPDIDPPFRTLLRGKEAPASPVGQWLQDADLR
jgi:hypothetical protein